MTNWRKELERSPEPQELNHASLHRDAFAKRSHGRAAAAVRDHIVRIYDIDPEPSQELKRTINYSTRTLANNWEPRGPQALRPDEEKIPAIRQAVAQCAQDYWEGFYILKEMQYANVRPGHERYSNPDAGRVLYGIYINRVTNTAQKRLEESGLTPTAALHTNAYIIKNVAENASYRLQFHAYVDPAMSPAIDEEKAKKQLEGLERFWELGVPFLKNAMSDPTPGR